LNKVSAALPQYTHTLILSYGERRTHPNSDREPLVDPNTPRPKIDSLKNNPNIIQGQSVTIQEQNYDCTVATL
jgi:hypothetical protein